MLALMARGAMGPIRRVGGDNGMRGTTAASKAKAVSATVSIAARRLPPPNPSLTRFRIPPLQSSCSVIIADKPEK